MDAALQAGVAIYNAGGYHAAHDAWEDRWLELESGSADERFLHGLIQFTAAIHHAQHANWEGVRGLAESGAGYLAELPADYRDVNVATVRAYLRDVAADPELVERRPPPALEVAGQAIGLDELDYRSVAVAAGVIAEEHDVYDEAVIEQAITFADEVVEARAAGSIAGDDRLVTLLSDFVGDPEHRPLVYDRLRAFVERRLAELEDPEGLFD